MGDNPDNEDGPPAPNPGERPNPGEDASGAASTSIALVPEPSDAGERIDRYLSRTVTDLSRSRVQNLIRDGHVQGPSGTIGDPGARVKPGCRYVVTLPPPEPAEPLGQEIPLTVVYEDRDLIVIDKPAGLVVHPAAGHADGTLVNALIAHCGDSLSGIGGVKRPGIVHRLDKETSGLLVVAKTDAAHHGLAEQFASHGEDGRLTRTYYALVWGIPDRLSGAVDARVGRSTSNRTKMAVVRGEAGRHAVTHYEVIETFKDEHDAPLAALLRLALETGRTHQIRVHMAHIGHPVMGDPVYGAGFKASTRKLSDPARRALEQLARQALHAAELGFEHPKSGKQLRFASPLPKDMAALADALRPTPDKNGKKKARPPKPAKARIAKA